MKKNYLIKVILLGILSFNTTSAYQLFCNEPEVLRELKNQFIDEMLRMQYVAENPMISFESYKRKNLEVLEDLSNPEKLRKMGMSESDIAEMMQMNPFNLQFLNIQKTGNACYAEVAHSSEEETAKISYELNPVKIIEVEMPNIGN